MSTLIGLILCTVILVAMYRLLSAGPKWNGEECRICKRQSFGEELCSECERSRQDSKQYNPIKE